MHPIRSADGMEQDVMTNPALQLLQLIHTTAHAQVISLNALSILQEAGA